MDFAGFKSIEGRKSFFKIGNAERYDLLTEKHIDMKSPEMVASKNFGKIDIFYFTDASDSYVVAFFGIKS